MYITKKYILDKSRGNYTHLSSQKRKTMKAYITEKAGGIEELQLLNQSMPVPATHEVLIEVKAISFNPVDYKARANENVLTWVAGDRRPVILGWDISGVITETGSKVAGFQVGDEVFGMVNFLGIGSAYAEYVAAPASHLAKKPANISHQEAAASTLAALTALQTLRKARVKAGEQVLIHAGSGGVGHFAIQIAKHLGAFVNATSSATNKDFVLSLGADRHIDYQKENLSQVLSDLDFVFNTVNKAVGDLSVPLLKNGGRLYSITARELSPEMASLAEKKKLEMDYHLVESNGEDMKTLANWLERGIMKAHVSKQFPFEELGKAHLAVETGRTVGKVVVTLP